MSANRLVLIARELMVDESGQPQPEVVTQTVRLHQAGWRIVILAPRPERWRPTRRSMDQAMGVQRVLHEALTRAGGDLDGVCYLEYGLFTRKRARTKALDELAARYGLGITDLVLVAHRHRQLELLANTGARVLAVQVENPPTSVETFPDFSAAAASLIS